MAADGAGDEVAAPGTLALATDPDGVVHLSATQLAKALDGLEWTRVSPKPVKQPAVVG